MFNTKAGNGWQAGERVRMKVPTNPLTAPYQKRPNQLNYWGDGSGRDSYVIYQHAGGNGREYRGGYVKEADWFRNEQKHPYETPIMNSRLVDEQMVLLGNTKYLTESQTKTRKKFIREQKRSIERLQESPERHNY